MSGPSEIGRSLILAGLALVGVGAVLTLVGRVPWLGRLPGDVVIRRERFTLYFPLATSLLVSLLLTLLFSFWRR
jgi:hypothetical protein